jgi:hypothetical protein
VEHRRDVQGGTLWAGTTGSSSRRQERACSSAGVWDESEEKSDKSALEALQRLMLRYETFWISRLGDTHAKVLVSDRKYAIVTSFNWLSFRGDPNRTFRDEQGTMVRIPELIDQKFDYLLSRLEAEKE